MSLASILTITIGMVVIYYVLSLAVSYINRQVLIWLNTSSKNFKEGLLKILDDKDVYNSFMAHVWIQNLKPKRVTVFGKQVEVDIDFIPTETFSKTLMNVLMQTEEGKNEIKDLDTAVARVPQGTNLRKLLDATLKSGADSLEKAHRSIDAWFDDAMMAVSSVYKQHARRWAVLIALILTLLTGADTLEMVEALRLSPENAAAISSLADNLIQQGGEVDAEEIIASLEEISAQDIPIFWKNGIPTEGSAIFYKVLGLIITWVAIAQGSSFWYQVLGKIRALSTNGG